MLEEVVWHQSPTLTPTPNPLFIPHRDAPAEVLEDAIQNENPVVTLNLICIVSPPGYYRDAPDRMLEEAVQNRNPTLTPTPNPLFIPHRAAPAKVLEEAVQRACMFSHNQPVGLDGARVMAAAVTWLARHDSRGPGVISGPRQLLEHLMGVAQTQDMRDKLQLLIDNSFQVRRCCGVCPLFSCVGSVEGRGPAGKEEGRTEHVYGEDKDTEDVTFGCR